MVMGRILLEVWVGCLKVAELPLEPEVMADKEDLKGKDNVMCFCKKKGHIVAYCVLKKQNASSFSKQT